jgi:hypothetical protein
MDQIVQKPGPYCARCEQPLVWHSTQQVKASDGNGEETMDIFRCEGCGRLSALPSVHSAA